YNIYRTICFHQETIGILYTASLIRVTGKMAKAHFRLHFKPFIFQGYQPASLCGFKHQFLGYNSSVGTYICFYRNLIHYALIVSESQQREKEQEQGCKNSTSFQASHLLKFILRQLLLNK